jgi:hypothetical protein
MATILDRARARTSDLNKVPPEHACYMDAVPGSGKRCANCVHFLGSKCVLVAGDIDAKMTCDYFSGVDTTTYGFTDSGKSLASANPTM